MPDIAIIGGGIGGLCTAIALQQRGLDVAVYEAAPALQPVGAGIWVPSNAMQIFERLKIDRPIAANGLALARVEICDPAGQPVQQIDLDEVRRTFGHTTISIHRAALQRVLADHVAPGALHLGKTCVAIDPGGDGVKVQFEDGSQIETSLLIGADGIHSTVRRCLFPQARLRYTGQTCYRGIASLRLPPDLARTAREAWGPGRRFGFSAIAEDAVYWFAPLDAPPGQSFSPDTIKAELLRRYTAFSPPTALILDGTPAQAIIQTDLYDLKPLDRWWQGRVVLLGDAAHAATPNLGQGAAQAIEDAYALAACLDKYDASDEAFARYQAGRMPKAKAVVRRSWWLGKLAHLRHPAVRYLRDALFRHTPTFVQRRELASLYTVSLEDAAG